jgi:hypothetical protein
MGNPGHRPPPPPPAEVRPPGQLSAAQPPLWLRRSLPRQDTPSPPAPPSAAGPCRTGRQPPRHDPNRRGRRSLRGCPTGPGISRAQLHTPHAAVVFVPRSGEPICAHKPGVGNGDPIMSEGIHTRPNEQSSHRETATPAYATEPSPAAAHTHPHSVADLRKAAATDGLRCLHRDTTASHQGVSGGSCDCPTIGSLVPSWGGVIRRTAGRAQLCCVCPRPVQPGGRWSDHAGRGTAVSSQQSGVRRQRHTVSASIASTASNSSSPDWRCVRIQSKAFVPKAAGAAVRRARQLR